MLHEKSDNHMSNAKTKGHDKEINVTETDK